MKVIFVMLMSILLSGCSFFLFSESYQLKDKAGWFNKYTGNEVSNEIYHWCNRHYHDNREAVGSDLDGKDVAIWSGKGDVLVKGSNVVAEQDLVMMGNNVSIVSDVNTHFQQDETTIPRN